LRGDGAHIFKQEGFELLRILFGVDEISDDGYLHVRHVEQVLSDYVACEVGGHIAEGLRGGLNEPMIERLHQRLHQFIRGERFQVLFL